MNVNMHARRLVVSILALTASGIVSAHAHAYLDHASPRVGSSGSAPREVRMWFTQALEPKFSSAQLRSSAGAVIGSGSVDSADPKEMVIPVRGLAPGQYKVFWKILSVDTHRTQGSFGFEVK